MAKKKLQNPERVDKGMLNMSLRILSLTPEDNKEILIKTGEDENGFVETVLVGRRTDGGFYCKKGDEYLGGTSLPASEVMNAIGGIISDKDGTAAQAFKMAEFKNSAENNPDNKPLFWDVDESDSSELLSKLTSRLKNEVLVIKIGDGTKQVEIGQMPYIDGNTGKKLFLYANSKGGRFSDLPLGALNTLVEDDDKEMNGNLKRAIASEIKLQTTRKKRKSSPNPVVGSMSASDSMAQSSEDGFIGKLFAKMKHIFTSSKDKPIDAMPLPQNIQTTTHRTAFEKKRENETGKTEISR